MAALDPGAPPDSHPDVPGQMGPRKGADPMMLHEHALEAEKHLEALATGMGQADAPENLLKAVASMADACRKIAKSMAKAPAPAPAPSTQPAPPTTMAGATNELAANARRQ